MRIYYKMRYIFCCFLRIFETAKAPSCKGRIHSLANQLAKNMSKTNEMYLDKARTLTKGLREHLETVKNYGVSANDLSKLEAAILEGEKLNAEVDRRRAELNEIVPNANRKLIEIRNLTTYLKSLVKPRVDSSHWPEYGIADKR